MAYFAIPIDANTKLSAYPPMGWICCIIDVDGATIKTLPIAPVAIHPITFHILSMNVFFQKGDPSWLKFVKPVTIKEVNFNALETGETLMVIFEA